MRKTLAVVTVLALLVLLAVALGVPRLAASPWLRDRVEAALGEATGRPVEMGALAFSWTDGLTVTDLAIEDRDGTEREEGPFLRTDRVHLELDLGSLLSRRVDIRLLELDAPSIVVVRDAGGELSISDLLGGGGPDAPPDDTAAASPDRPPSADAPGGGDGGGSGLDAVSARVLLRDGRLLFVDHRLSARWLLEELDGELTLSAGRVDGVLDGLLNGGPTHVVAEADLSVPRYRLSSLDVEQAELGAQFAQLAYLVPLFGEKPNAVGGKMDLHLQEITASGRGREELAASLAGSGELRFADGRLESRPIEEIVDALESFGVDTEVDRSQPGIAVTLLTSSFRMENGEVRSQATLDAEGLDLEVDGRTGLDGRIDHRVVVLELNRVLEKNPDLRKYVTDADQLPITIRGSIERPRVGVDVEQAVVETLVDKLDDLIGDGLDSLFGKKKRKKQDPAPEPAPEPSPEPPATP